MTSPTPSPLAAEGRPAAKALSATAPRKAPSLDRGVKRVKSLLDGRQCFAEASYGATSMNAIARRAKAVIGSLYQFFPTKEAVGAALIERYATDLKACWEALDVEAMRGDYSAFAHGLVLHTLQQIDRQPAFSTLQDAQANFGVRPGNHGELQHSINILIGRLAPSTDIMTRDRLGLITLQMIKAAHALHRNETEIVGNIDIVDEMSSIIAGYLRRNIK